MKQHASPLLVLAAIMATSGFMAGCAETVNTRGQVILPSRLAQVQPGVTTRQDVLQLLGSPSTSGTLNDNRWYYVTSSIGTTSLDPYNLKSRQVVVIDFDPKSDVVATVTQKGKDDGKEISPDDKVTPTHGQAMGIVDQVVDTLGGVLKK